MQLNSSQHYVFNRILNNVIPNHRKHVIQGYAGCGKTVLACQLIKTCIDNNIIPIVSAPTYMALSVLAEKCQLFDIKVMSGATAKQNINHFLDFKGAFFFTYASLTGKHRVEQEDEETGEVKRVFTSGNQERSLFSVLPDLLAYNPKIKFCFILDETSMLTKRDDELITTNVKELNSPLLLIGDNAQLPPVKAKRADIFNKDDNSILNIIVRQSLDSGIILLSKQIRSGTAINECIKFADEVKKGVEVLPRKEALKDYIEDAALMDSEKTYRPANSVVMLCYTNKSVNTFNNLVSQSLYGHGMEKLRKGQRLVCTDTISVYDKSSKSREIIAYNSEPVRVLAFSNDKVDVNYKGESLGFKANEVLIQTINGATVKGYYIPKDSRENVFEESPYERAKKYYFNAALKANKDAKDGRISQNERREAWTRYFYVAEDCLIPLALPYSSTVHKAQGSTFLKAYVNVNDITKCMDEQVMRSLMYVAVTRASDHLVLVHNR